MSIFDAADIPLVFGRRNRNFLAPPYPNAPREEYAVTTHDCGEGVTAEVKTRDGICILQLYRDGSVIQGNNSHHVTVWYLTSTRPVRVYPFGKVFNREDGDQMFVLQTYGTFELRHADTNAKIATLSFEMRVVFG